MSTPDMAPPDPTRTRPENSIVHEAEISSWRAPWVWYLGVVALVVAGLATPLRLPVGPNYWDLVVYLDASWRIALGQIPNVDFFTPVGPLGYYLFRVVQIFFPHGHPLLVAQWSLLIVTLPLFLPVARSALRRSPLLGIGLLAPFVFFSLVPLNGTGAFPAPGVDGYGIYNRQTSLLLYVLVASILFDARSRSLPIVVAATLVSLALTKITGFVVAVPLVVLGTMSGRIRAVPLAISLVVATIILAALDWRTGLLSAYIGNLATLLALNNTTLISRFAPVITVQFDVIAPLIVLMAWLLWIGRRRLIAKFQQCLAVPAMSRIADLLDSIPVWLAGLLAISLAFESQNTGSLEFLCIWPALLRLLWCLRKNPPRERLVANGLIVLICIPTVTMIAHRAARTFVSAFAYRDISGIVLRDLGGMSGKAASIERARIMNDHYSTFATAYKALAQRNQLPTSILTAEPDFQISWLYSVADAVTGLRAFESASNRHINSIFALDFADPFNWLLRTKPPRRVSIAIDPERTLPATDRLILAELAATDAILEPMCPTTPARIAIRNAFATALEGRDIVRISQCWTLYLKR